MDFQQTGFSFRSMDFKMCGGYLEYSLTAVQQKMDSFSNYYYVQP